jgi:hypothetical protein
MANRGTAKRFIMMHDVGVSALVASDGRVPAPNRQVSGPGHCRASIGRADFVNRQTRPKLNCERRRGGTERDVGFSSACVDLARHYRDKEALYLLQCLSDNESQSEIIRGRCGRDDI